MPAHMRDDVIHVHLELLLELQVSRSGNVRMSANRPNSNACYAPNLSYLCFIKLLRMLMRASVMSPLFLGSW